MDIRCSKGQLAIFAYPTNDQSKHLLGRVVELINPIGINSYVEPETYCWDVYPSLKDENGWDYFPEDRELQPLDECNLDNLEELGVILDDEVYFLFNKPKK